jgi:hypothetical protein
MNKKKAFVLRIDSEKLDALEKWASDEFRSMNGQLEWIIEKSLKEAGRIKSSKNKDQGENNENKPSAEF